MKVEKVPAFYAMGTDRGWKDYFNLLHLPYTLWHLSYVVLGAAIAPEIHLDRLLITLLAFFLAVGIGAHALDELNGRPLGTRIPKPVLLGLGIVPLCGAIALGGTAAVAGTAWILPFVAFGGFIVIAYKPRPLERQIPFGFLVRFRLGRLPCAYVILDQFPVYYGFRSVAGFRLFPT